MHLKIQFYLLGANIRISDSESELEFDSSDSESDDDCVISEANNHQSEEINNPNNNVASSSHDVESTDSHGNEIIHLLN